MFPVGGCSPRRGVDSEQAITTTESISREVITFLGVESSVQAIPWEIGHENGKSTLLRRVERAMPITSRPSLKGEMQLPPMQGSKGLIIGGYVWGAGGETRLIVT